MSYILDALRKSDQQRRRGAPPTLLAAHAAPVETRRRALVWYGLFALVLVSAGVAIGLTRPWQRQREATVVAVTKPPDQVVNPTTGTTSQEGIAKSEPAIPPAAPLVPPVPAASSSADAAASGSAATGRSATEARKKATKPVKARRNTGKGFAKADGARDTPANGSGKTPRSDKAMNTDESAPEETAVPIAELPVAIQKELPAMSIMVHAYSDDPAKRLVGINNHLLHEGEEVAPGLKLEQITLDGMILSFKGYRFRRGAR